MRFGGSLADLMYGSASTTISFHPLASVLMFFHLERFRALLLVGLAVLVTTMWPTVRFLAEVGSACSAKTLCSAVFVSNRTAESVDLGLECSSGLVPYIAHTSVDHKARTVTSTIRLTLGSFQHIARHYGPYRGCSLLPADKITPGEPPRPAEKKAKAGKAWPAGNEVEIDTSSKLVKQVAEVIDSYFGNSTHPDPYNTRGMVVVQKGKILYEKYFDEAGFTADTPQLGWSMTKSVLNALVGIRIKQGKLSLDQNASDFIAEWKNDNRSAITIRDMLRMSSGLEWSEVYDFFNTDVVPMLYSEDSAAARQISKTLGHTHGEHWYYSSGSSNALSLLLQRSFDRADRYLTFPRSELFEKLAADSFVMETDRRGTFVASSFSYATPRDWARFGQLFLQDGVWNGERLLPEGWVSFSVTPVAESRGLYGGHWWRADSDWENISHPVFQILGWAVKDLPKDTYFASGYAGQYVIVIPSEQLVLVRLGCTPVGSRQFHLGEFAGSILSALKQ